MVPATTGPFPVQRLIADLAARFTTVEPDAIDDAILAGLRQVAEALHLDLAVLSRKPADGASPVVSHGWIKHPQPLHPDSVQLVSLPFIASKLASGEAAWFSQIDEVPDDVDRDALLQQGLRSAAAVPVALSDGCGDQGALAFGSTTSNHEWSPAMIEQLRVASGVFGQALARQASLKALRRALEELEQQRARGAGDEQGRRKATVSEPSRARDHRQAEDVDLRCDVEERLRTGPMVGQSSGIRRVLEQVRQVAVTDSTVLLLGETGTGKEVIAAQIHELSARRGRTMVRVNCSAIPTTLIESELFGREKGAFTGALARQVGRFELADHSTIFLDEIGDLPADVQVKLLRVLEERQIERLGNPKGVHVDVRIIAATHRDLEKRIADGSFREDLFYRLNVFPILVPPLRGRPEDIPLLVWRFVAEFSKAFGKRIDAIPGENMKALQQYAWPGNIRELRNVVERAMIVATGTRLTIALPTPSGSAEGRSVKLVDVEREHLRSVLESSGWRIRGAGGAAERLGLRPTTLETRLAKLGLARPKRH
jgi:transcriptional regulator with GAF, ATPase, and Fis domain